MALVLYTLNNIKGITHLNDQRIRASLHSQFFASFSDGMNGLTSPTSVIHGFSVGLAILRLRWSWSHFFHVFKGILHGFWVSSVHLGGVRQFADLYAGFCTLYSVLFLVDSAFDQVNSVDGLGCGVGNVVAESGLSDGHVFFVDKTQQLASSFI